MSKENLIIGFIFGTMFAIGLGVMYGAVNNLIPEIAAWGGLAIMVAIIINFMELLIQNPLKKPTKLRLRCKSNY